MVFKIDTAEIPLPQERITSLLPRLASSFFLVLQAKKLLVSPPSVREKRERAIGYGEVVLQPGGGRGGVQPAAAAHGRLRHHAALRRLLAPSPAQALRRRPVLLT